MPERNDAYSKGTLPTDGSAAIVVKAADGMYVKTSISEMELDSVKVGGTIKCVSSDTGDEYTAEVKEISDFPISRQLCNGGEHLTKQFLLSNRCIYKRCRWA